MRHNFTSDFMCDLGNDYSKTIAEFYACFFFFFFKSIGIAFKLYWVVSFSNFCSPLNLHNLVFTLRSNTCFLYIHLGAVKLMIHVIRITLLYLIICFRFHFFIQFSNQFFLIIFLFSLCANTSVLIFEFARNNFVLLSLCETKFLVLFLQIKRNFIACSKKGKKKEKLNW